MVIVLTALLLDRLAPRDTHVVTGSGPDVCFALSVIESTVLRDRIAPPFASPEQAAAVNELNADLAQMRDSLFHLQGIRQLGCREGG